MKLVYIFILCLFINFSYVTKFVNGYVIKSFLNIPRRLPTLILNFPIYIIPRLYLYFSLNILIFSQPVFCPTKNSKTPFNPTKHRNWNLVNDETCGSSSENRIIGGANANFGQYPWIARIGYRDEDDNIIFSCAATLISKNHVVTAAHCATNLPKNLKMKFIKLGEYNTEKEIDCVEDVCAPAPKNYDAEKVFIHKHYGEPKFVNDIAIIKLNETIHFTKWVSPICLPFGSLLHKNLTGSLVDIIGWGFTDTVMPISSVILQSVKLRVLATSICIREYRRKYIIEETKQLCVGGKEGKDSCTGDSGGPLIKVGVEGSDGPKYYLFGIVSYGATNCGVSSLPAIYTKIAHYVKWILDSLSINELL